MIDWQELAQDWHWIDIILVEDWNRIGVDWSLIDTGLTWHGLALDWHLDRHWIDIGNFDTTQRGSMVIIHPLCHQMTVQWQSSGS